MEKQLANSLKQIDPLNGREGTVFDKPAPDGPPQAPIRQIPSYLKKVVGFMSGIIADESLLLDLCVDRAIGIVEFNYKKRAFGSDLFAEQQPNTMHFVGMAAPLAIELYKQVLVSIGDRSEEYTKLLAEAQKEMESGGRTPPTILVP